MKNSVCPRLLATAAVALFSNFLALSIHAQEVERIPRFFFHSLPFDAAENGTDLVAEGSQRVVVQSKNAGSGTLNFGVPDNVSWFPSDFQILDADGNLILDLAGTSWARAPMVHITDDGVEKVDFVYWLIGEGEDPQMLNGLTAATGPEGNVMTLENVRLSMASDGTFYIVRNNSGNIAVRFCEGLFNK